MLRKVCFVWEENIVKTAERHSRCLDVEFCFGLDAVCKRLDGRVEASGREDQGQQGHADLFQRRIGISVGNLPGNRPITQRLTKRPYRI